jgi:hypothetical protein
VPGQTDKAGAANPQNLNRYTYVNNNPLNHTDPTGHFVCLVFCAVGAVGEQWSNLGVALLLEQLAAHSSTMLSLRG